MSTRELPAGLTVQLNGLGFALILERGSPTYTFSRFSPGGELFLTVEPLQDALWRVGVRFRSNMLLGSLPGPEVEVELGRLGPSTDGKTIDLPAEDLLSDLPALIETAILPSVDREFQ